MDVHYGAGSIDVTKQTRNHAEYFIGQPCQWHLSHLCDVEENQSRNMQHQSVAPPQSRESVIKSSDDLVPTVSSQSEPYDGWPSDSCDENYYSHLPTTEKFVMSCMRDQPRVCEACGNTKWVVRAYSVLLCKNCVKFVRRVPAKDFQDLRCWNGGKCDTRHRSGSTKCPACRARVLAMLDIRHPAWIRYRETLTNRGCGRSNTRMIQNQDVEPADTIHKSDSERLQSTGQVNGRDRPNHCSGCGSNKWVKRHYGEFVCHGCAQFMSKLVGKRFRVHCTGLHNNCRVSYAPGRRIKCPACRLRNLLKLNFNHPAWVRYKSQMTRSSLSEPVMSEQPNTPGCGTLQIWTGRQVPEPVNQKLTQHQLLTTQSEVQAMPSGRHADRCVACGNFRSVKKCYGAVLCSSCVAFVNSIAKRNFKVTCLRRNKCITIWRPGSIMECSACRVRSLLKFNLKHPAWVEYASQLPRPIEWSNQDHGGDPPLVEGPPDIRPSDNFDGGESRQPEGQQEGQASICRGCGNPRWTRRFYGLILCQNCSAFMLKTARKNLQFECIGSGNCDITYRAGQAIHCSACRIRALMKLNIRQPAWVEYCEALRQHEREKESSAWTHSGRFTNFAGNFKAESTFEADSELGISGQSASQTKCMACGCTNKVRKCFGILICHGCMHFVIHVAGKRFDVRCVGQGTCNTNYRPGLPIRCVACRVEILLKLDIRHPAWIEYKRSRRAGSMADAFGRQTPRFRTRSPRAACGICGNTKHVHRKTETFTCCEGCWEFLKRCAGHDFQVWCSTGRHDCQLEHPSLAPTHTPMCRGCRLGRAISMGFRHPKLDMSKYGLWQQELSADDSCANTFETTKVFRRHRFASARDSCDICGHAERLSKRREGYIACQNCLTFLSKVSLGDDFPPDCETGHFKCKLKHISIEQYFLGSRMCRGCRVRRALDLGYRPPRLRFGTARSHASESNSLFEEGGELHDSDEDEDDVTILYERISAPVDARRAAFMRRVTKRPCAVCFRKCWTTISTQGFAECASCVAFLKSTERMNFPLYCITGRWTCRQERALSDRSDACSSTRIMSCAACRLKMALNLGYTNANIESWLEGDELQIESLDTPRDLSPIVSVPDDDNGSESVEPSEPPNIVSETQDGLRVVPLKAIEGPANRADDFNAEIEKLSGWYSLELLRWTQRRPEIQNSIVDEVRGFVLM